jgi:N-acetylglucosamine-6-phosphate deacetylase
MRDSALLISAGKIAAYGPRMALQAPEGAARIDAFGQYLVPGFIDLQLNGAFGWDFTESPAGIWPAAEKLPEFGVTAFLPTIISSPPERTAAAQEVLANSPSNFMGARPLGLHLEGPFLNVLKKGAHSAQHLREPDLTRASAWQIDQHVRMVTLAPELPGALELISVLTQRGLVAAAGHSMASSQIAEAGLKAGLRYGTHLFNAMAPLNHREPGISAALLAHPEAVVGLIADGIHLDPLVVDLVWRLVGSRRISLVSDAVAALGMPSGPFPLGEETVHAADGAVRLADGTLAGSTLSLDQALRNLMGYCGCRLNQALPSLTTTPARLLGLDHQIGMIEPGRSADLVLLDGQHQVMKTFVEGEPVYERETAV